MNAISLWVSSIAACRDNARLPQAKNMQRQSQRAFGVPGVWHYMAPCSAKQCGSPLCGLCCDAAGSC